MNSQALHVLSQIFDVSFGMFVHDDELRQFWFSRQSLETEREFELIGILLGVAIYNGVILDLRFPHVVYKKCVCAVTRPERLTSSARSSLRQPS